MSTAMVRPRSGVPRAPLREQGGVSMTLQYLLTFVGLLSTTTAAQPLRIEGIEFCQGPIGPARPAQYLEHESVCVRFRVLNPARAGSNCASMTTQAEIIGPTGKVNQAPRYADTGALMLGASYTSNVSFRLQHEDPPGEYIYRCTVRDNLTWRTASFQRKFTILPRTFGMTAPEFYADPEGKFPAPHAGFCLQRLYFRYYALRVESPGGKFELDTTFVALDAKTGQPVAVAFDKTLRTELPLPTQPTDVYVGGYVGLHQAGEFILRFSIKDLTSGKTASRDVPVRVLAP
jgi:hypothetical protein